MKNMNEKIFKFVCDEDTEEIRIDRLLAELNSDLSRSYIKKLIDAESALVNGKPVKASFIPKAGDELILRVPESTLPDIAAEDIPLDIIYEDEDVIIINKPKNMVVHPAPGNYSGTIVNALMYHCKDNLSGINGILRPGIVHRIDKDTTGVIMAAKNDISHRCLADQLKVHSITRRYRAICFGTFKEKEGIVDAPIGRNNLDRKKMSINRVNGKEAITHYRVLASSEEHKLSYIECVLETGRTHQIRVHMASISHPLLGDTVYGGERRENLKIFGQELNGQCLHAMVLGFIHPSTNEYMEFSAELPAYFQNILSHLNNE